MFNESKPGACIGAARPRIRARIAQVFIPIEGESFDHREELLDDFGTAHGPFLLVGETVVSRQLMQNGTD